MLRKGLKEAWEKLSKNTQKELDGAVKSKPQLMVQNPYHHNFIFNFDKKRDTQKIIFDAFDLLRVFGVAFFIIKIGMKLPSYALFRRTKFENNPDFMLCDQAQFEKMENDK